METGPMTKIRLLPLLSLLFLAGLELTAAEDRAYRADSESKAYHAPQRFRLGIVVDAGISQQDVNIFNRDKLLDQQKFRKKVCAMIRVKLDKGRSISIHDFTLINNYQAFDCVAIKPYQSSFNAEKRIFPSSKQNNVYDLLFYLDIPDFKPSGELKATLHYRLTGGGLTDTEIKLKNFGNSTIQFAMPPADEEPAGENNAPSST